MGLLDTRDKALFWRDFLNSAAVVSRVERVLAVAILNNSHFIAVVVVREWSFTFLCWSW